MSFKSPRLDELRSSGMKGSKAGMKQVFSSHVSALIFHTRRQVSSRFHLSPLKKACDSLATSFSAQRELGLC